MRAWLQALGASIRRLFPFWPARGSTEQTPCNLSPLPLFRRWPTTLAESKALVSLREQNWQIRSSPRNSGIDVSQQLLHTRTSGHPPARGNLPVALSPSEDSGGPPSTAAQHARLTSRSCQAKNGWKCMATRRGSDDQRWWGHRQISRPTRCAARPPERTGHQGEWALNVGQMASAGAAYVKAIASDGPCDEVRAADPQLHRYSRRLMRVCWQRSRARESIAVNSAEMFRLRFRHRHRDRRRGVRRRPRIGVA